MTEKEQQHYESMRSFLTQSISELEFSNLWSVSDIVRQMLEAQEELKRTGMNLHRFQEWFEEAQNKGASENYEVLRMLELLAKEIQELRDKVYSGA